ncbi:MAG: ECF transporter S component [Coriobacteriia bacterium]|nr:ECF transporter S component [Coriobacteriia bacterium]
MNKRLWLVLVPVGVGLNIVGGLLNTTLKLPLFLDTIGTMLVAVILGPWIGALTGGLSNVIMAIQNPQDMFFAIVNILVGIITGYTALAFGYRKWFAPLIAGLGTAVAASIVGPLIGTYIYGGLTGGVLDVAVAGLLKSGQDLFSAVFFSRVGPNLADKVLSAFLVFGVVMALPASFRGIADKQGSQAPPAPAE